ncbi:hypothetical protein G8V07_16390 [Clostridium botulinum D/C]|uniref:hypothetical protein n=1 Tax=Clostridium botulinum TaxID=1491 RepID=UPI001E2C42B0|nr:hypothetical protein [Clostridium botulinum]MCD3322056.1 hypothetical protein [Clostridium botulinum D/C]MCD3325273.1 hypothetical protein [Clostridium botulinum D/C]MCD3328389.1 hypothetical protein [Clostridium botulinum D/C]
MNIKKWTSSNKKVYKLKKGNGGIHMVLELSDYRKSNPSIKLSFVEMLFDKEKRQAIYAKYDKNYQSTKEEDEIYNEMRGLYREED